jgi:L-ascorbate metabolism protein UlaG (beta-lactamase superfamily)
VQRTRRNRKTFSSDALEWLRLYGRSQLRLLIASGEITLASNSIASFGAIVAGMVFSLAGAAATAQSPEKTSAPKDPAGNQAPAQQAEKILNLPASSGQANFDSGSVMFVGNATVVIRYGGFTILTDPNFLHKGGHVHLGYGLESKRLTEPAIGMDQLPPIDLIVLSHMHGDHFDHLVQEKLNRNIPIVTTSEAAEELEKMGFKARHPLDRWESLAAKKGDATLRITSTPARHGPPVASIALPDTMGSMLEFIDPDGRVHYRIYISGDTLVHDAIEEIPKRYPDVDLALLHLGGTKILNTVLVTMDADQGVQMMKIIAPKRAIPIHYNDYDVFKSPIEDFEQLVKDTGLQDKVTYLKHGETYQFRGKPR